jgi:hypothetical protein
MMYETAAEIAHERGLDGRLSMALFNLGWLQMGRDVERATGFMNQALPAARRAGWRDMEGQMLAGLADLAWVSGDLDEVLRLVAAVRALDPDPMLLTTLHPVELWASEARGADVPTAPDDVASDHELALALNDVIRIEHARRSGDVEGAADGALPALRHALAALGLEDEFQLLWPPLVLVALDERDVALAEHLLEPVESAPPGRVTAAVRAQLHRLRGLVRAARGDDPGKVEADLRDGIRLLQEYGWPTAYGPAQEELGRWLAEQGRSDEAAEMLDAARATYEQIGAAGWLRRLDQQRGTDPGQRLARL